MRIWHDWTHEERALFERFHRDFNTSLCSLEELSRLKAIIDIQVYVMPLEAGDVWEANHIMDCVEVGLLSKETGCGS